MGFLDAIWDFIDYQAKTPAFERVRSFLGVVVRQCQTFK